LKTHSNKPLQPNTIMSADHKNTDLNQLAKDAERDLNSTAAKQGHAGSDSSTFHPLFPSFPPTNLPQAIDSGIDESVTSKFPGSTVEYGTGGSANRTIPESEGGDINKATGQPLKAGDFARGGVGAPEARDEGYARNHGGEDDVRGNTVDGATLRQSGAK
jgi:hypothetical protein